MFCTTHQIWTSSPGLQQSTKSFSKTTHIDPGIVPILSLFTCSWNKYKSFFCHNSRRKRKSNHSSHRFMLHAVLRLADEVLIRFHRILIASTKWEPSVCHHLGIIFKVRPYLRNHFNQIFVLTLNRKSGPFFFLSILHSSCLGLAPSTHQRHPDHLWDPEC